MGTCVLVGFGVGITLLIPWAMLPDIIELDELETGKRREAIFYGIFVMIQKIAFAVALLMSTISLGWANYITPTDDNLTPQQPDSVILTLRLFMSFLPIAFTLLTFICMLFYPITKEKHEEIKKMLEEKKQKAKIAERF
eukprot:TRINITY_DN2511_c0_g1_i4.p1 TRINITY_DN2511_c0_g1~~TRINITY_DN2511_c0_g1_i4.p1  ORF type:complete len:139 (-),score=44.50 TRINITY_DN2511_c0_g1_i4:95-511(-)